MINPAPYQEEFFFDNGETTSQSFHGGSFEQLSTIREDKLSEKSDTEQHLALLEQYEQAQKWPSLDNISFNEAALFGGTLPPTPDSQVRAVLRGTIEAADELQNNNPSDILPRLDISDPMTVNARLGAVQSYFKKQRTISPDSKPKPIGYYVQFSEIKVELMHLLEKQNHPLYQALNQVRLDSARRQTEAALDGGRTTFMSRADIEKLEENIIKFAFTEDIIAFADMRIKDLRRTDRERRAKT
ncbi:MAG TPA: hypothetical protein VFN56_03580 [Candidatus Saccharimonadales bacterium]|nr:hypothetical protein [Candidatus Saccharimonadales bacterium]